MAGLPMLMPGWTEHVGPQGQLYWYNASLQQSTYARPSSVPPGFTGHIGQPMPMYTGPPPSVPSSSQAIIPQSEGNSSVASSSKSKVKKEKPAKKEAIPGADGWLRVTTTLGNIFYTHVESKRSEWTVPEEIKEQVATMQEEERRVKALEEEEARLAKEQQEDEERQAREEENRKRLQQEEEERKKRIEELKVREEAVIRQRKERERIQEERLRILQEQGKRKRRDESVVNDEADVEKGDREKKVRLDAESVDEVKDDDKEGDEEEKEEEESWQRQMAAEMAAAAEIEDEAEQGEDSKTSFIAEQSNGLPPNFVADTSKLDLSVEEGKALFIHMLTSFNGTPNEVNPMAPWDRELPKFVHHRDYTVLTSLRDRQDAFNEWCKLKIREKRNKAKENIPSIRAKIEDDNSAKGGTNGQSEQNKESASEVAYRALLLSEVKSTRTKWEDFKRSWRKDRRFFAFGRDDRVREKVFRSWLKELGEKKRIAAEQAEEDFLALLEEILGQEYRLDSSASIEDTQTTWTKAKRRFDLDKDARYESVGSSSRRAELFADWAKGKRRRREQSNHELKEGQASPKAVNTAKDGTDRALREREEAVEKKRRELESKNRRAFGQATREESLISFRQLLVDAIRDPLMPIQEAIHLLASDVRFDTPGIRMGEKEQLVHQHLCNLNEKRLAELHSVFEKYATALDIEAEVALPLIKNDDELQRRKLDQIQVIQSGKKNMDDLFDEWRQQQEDDAAAAFQQMLKENAFINFWGGLRQEHEQRKGKERENGDDKASGKRQGEDEEDDDEPDLLQMAANVDLEEIHSILRNDQRYRAFRHRHQQREEWIRSHIQTMSVPKKTVFQQAT